MRFEGGATTRATPVIEDGVMYIGSGTRLYALNAATGERLWTIRPDQDAPTDLDTAGIGDVLNAGRAIPSPPGVSVGDGKVFVGLMDGRVGAVSQETGAFLWTTQIGYTPARAGQAVSGSPLYADGVVFAGLANGDWAFRGKVVALDAEAGEVLWDFWTIPGPGEPGHDTWPRERPYADVWRQGGAGVWHIGNLDLGLVYFVTGNAVPMFGGEARKGDNLYTASILAHDATTGELRWHYQVVHHDLWDAHIAIAPVLFNAVVDGRSRKGLAALRADGYIFMLDRDNVVSPGAPIPGIRVTSMSYSPDTGYFYAQGRGHVGRARPISDDPWFRGSASGYSTLPPAVGVFGAIDSRTNKIVWKHEVASGIIGTSGPLTTAGGLMFRGSGDGYFQAYDARTGHRLWAFQTGVRGSRGAAATYAVDGEQYVALAMGPELWAFKLGGTLPPRDAPPTTGGPRSVGRVTNQVQTSTLVESAERGVGLRYAVDEHAFNPSQVRASTGTVVTFVNSGRITHTVSAIDGGWTTGPLAMAESGFATFDRPGTHTYHCEEHPWAMGQVFVEP